jgi:hypothetical protein
MQICLFGNSNNDLEISLIQPPMLCMSISWWWMDFYPCKCQEALLFLFISLKFSLGLVYTMDYEIGTWKMAFSMFWFGGPTFKVWLYKALGPSLGVN